MKYTDYSLLLAALLAAGANAQATTIINDPADTNVVTIHYSVCPTAATTTVTLPSTITFCPGGVDCNGGHQPTITAPPNPAVSTSTLLHVTFTGSDGKVTELAEYVTVFDAPCTRGPGMCQATYTITESEDCACHTNPAALPSGFTTTVHQCNVCGPNGGPSTITQTVPCTTGPYADVTPNVGPTPAPGSGAPGAPGAPGAGAGAPGAGAGASAGAAASAGANAAAGSNGSSGSNAAAGSNDSGSNAAANANAAAGASAAAGGNAAPAAGGSTPAGMGGSTPADMGGSVAGSNSSAGSAGSAMAGGNGAAPAGMAGNGGSGNNMQGNGTSPAIAGYTGAGDRTAFACTTLFAAVVGSLAWML